MKRFGVRIAAVATLVVVGGVVAFQILRNGQKPAVAAETDAPRRIPAADGAKPIPTKETADNPLRAKARSPMLDPFARPAAAALPIESPPGAAMAGGDIPDPQPPVPMQGGERLEPYAPPRALPGAPPTARAARDEPPQPMLLPRPPREADLAANTRAMPRGGEGGYAPPGELPVSDTAPGAFPVLGPADGREARPLRADPFARTPAASATAAESPRLPEGLPPMPGGERLDGSRLTPPTGEPSLSAAAPSTETLDASGEGSGRPGSKNLEGAQSPQLQIQKFAPAEVQVGKPATFRIAVRNTGTAPAAGVEIHDQIPKGTKVLSSNPRATNGVRGDLVWTLGSIKPGEEVSVEVQLMPTAEGEIGSVATVQFAAEASARTTATRPQLVIETTIPDRVQIGEQVAMQIVVSNPGTGVATGVIIEEHIPAGLQHAAGADLEYELGSLKPGESRKLDLALTATRPGPVTNILSVRGEGNLRAESRKQIEITAPQLELALEGPKKRYLEREATYQLSIHNPGTAPAQKVELVAYLPQGLKFVSANNAGRFDETNRAVVWRLEELPVRETGTVELVTLPIEAGQQTLKLRTAADRGISAEKEHPVVIEGIAAILFQAADTIDPVEVGGETTYEVRVVNQGSKAATNVRLAVQLPPELKPLAADGPSRYTIQGNQVLFEGLARLAPKADTTYRIRVQGVRPGDLRTRIQLSTDEMQTPVLKEESTRVYADE